MCQTRLFLRSCHILNQGTAIIWTRGYVGESDFLKPHKAHYQIMPLVATAAKPTFGPLPIPLEPTEFCVLKSLQLKIFGIEIGPERRF